VVADFSDQQLFIPSGSDVLFGDSSSNLFKLDSIVNMNAIVNFFQDSFLYLEIR
jgi:hypothetical protein